MENYYDVIIVGAGLSGINAGYRLQTECPQKSYTILEGRGSMGGTWDLFRYPGIRSDSDIFTFGFPFNPWKKPDSIADGPSILQYIKDTARDFGIDEKIQYRHKVTDASWNDSENLWTLTIAQNEQVKHSTLKCGFLLMCSGYYDYEKGYLPEFKGSNDFKGQIVHPQKWTSNIVYAGKKVIVIGSGATAVTLVPSMAGTAEKVTMLQRTPTYITVLPQKDPLAAFLQKMLPDKWAYNIVRWRNILLSIAFYKAARSFPNAIGKFLRSQVKKVVGKNYNEKDFSPPYKPWDQRLCVVPDGDLFKALKSGKAEIVTDHISHFTEKGIMLKSGKELEADLIVTATGLNMQLFGGMTMHKNGQPVSSSDTFAYRGVLFSNIPNFAVTIGYINASWTLKSDLSARFVTKVLNYMDKNNYSVCTPQLDITKVKPERLMDFDSGYVLRAETMLPKQGDKHPWKVYQNYVRDLISMEWERVNDNYLHYK